MPPVPNAPLPNAPVPGRAYEVLTPGEKFGDHQVLRCVSYDLLGSLYRVRRPRSKEEKTVFVMPPVIQATEEFQERFKQQAPKLCDLKHDNVFSFDNPDLIKDRFTFYGGPFEGENLADYLQAYVNKEFTERAKEDEELKELVSDMPMGLPPEEVRPILTQILDGLEYLSKNRILHLNLNPTNILCTKDGKIKIAGFGLMSLIGQQSFEEIVSAGIPPIALGGRAIRINTVDILSPEARQGKPSDARSDVYALGITAYWLLTGRKPTADYVAPSKIVEDLDEKWDLFIANCLDREPEKRYQNVSKAKEDFNDFSHIKLLRNRQSSDVIGTTDTSTIFRHLDFIPVPKKIQERGKNTARAFRLAIVGAVGLVAAYLIFSLLNLMLGDEDYGGRVAIKTPAGKEPKLTFNIEPDKASIRISSTDSNFIVRNGKLDLNILPGSYRFVFSSPGFQKASRLLQIEREPQVINIRLKPDLVDAVFTSDPGTTLKAIGSDGTETDLGTTNAEGVLSLVKLLTAGEYDIVASKDDYLPTTTGPYQLVASEPNQFEIPLEAVLGVLRVRSNPKGAEIFYKDESVGTTNATIEDLPVEEEFVVTLKKEGYRDSTLAVVVKSDTRTILDFGDLTPLSGEVIPVIKFAGQNSTAEQLQGIQVTGTSKNPILGEQSFSASGSQLVDGQILVPGINEGTVELTVDHPNYKEQSRSFTLNDKVRLKVVYDLQALPGVITLSPTPAGAEWTVTVNGREVAPKDLKISLPAGRRSEIGLSNVNFFPETKVFTLTANEQVEWAPAMRRIPGPETGNDFEVPFLDMPLKWIPSGSFTMGSPPTEPARLPEEGPETEMTISQGFWMGAREVSQTQYEEIIGENPSKHLGENKPVDYVTWEEAMAYCEKLNEREKEAERLPSGYEYRLPTEAEWEYAARAGSRTPFHWGDTADASQGNFKGKYPRDFTSGKIDTPDHYGSLPVGGFKPNAWGLYDMHGNVREWCMDSYSDRLPGGIETDWVRLSGSSRHVVRGGGWEDFAIHSRAGSRTEGLGKRSRTASTGFRIVLAPVIDR